MKKKMPTTIKAAIIGALIAGMFMIASSLMEKRNLDNTNQNSGDKSENEMIIPGDIDSSNINTSKEAHTQTMTNSPNSMQIQTEDISGGIATHTLNINVSPQSRQLSKDSKLKLIEVISHNQEKKIEITAVLGNQEAFSFATSIKEFLQSEGYAVDGVNQAIFKEPVEGQLLHIGDKAIEIIIGGR